MAGKKNAKIKKPSRRIDWDPIREDFLLQNLDPAREEPYTLVAVAKTWGVSRSALDKQSRKEHWRDELIVRAKAQADASIDRRTETIAEVEREARARHATFMKGLIFKAAQRFKEIKNPKKDLSIDQMIQMLRFALPEERAALGIPKYLSITTTMPTDRDRELETPGRRIERRRLERAVKKELLALIVRAAEEDGDEEP